MRALVWLKSAKLQQRVLTTLQQRWEIYVARFVTLVPEVQVHDTSLFFASDLVYG
jgi:hypothetical protein